MKIHHAVNRFVERMKTSGLPFQRIDTAPWIEEFEAKLPRRLPPSFASLVTRYSFLSFELAEVEFFANLGDHEEEELVEVAFKDQYLWRPALAQGFIQIGRPTDGSYDPVSFDMRTSRSDGEWPLVRLDHEELLQRERVVICEEIAESFLALITASREGLMEVYCWNVK